jgi:hypothetical protein
VLTVGRVPFTLVLPFLRASAKAEAHVLEAPGLTWATGLDRPPFVDTCSLWESTEAISACAYGSHEPAHPRAIALDRAKPFHRQEVFIPFRPDALQGHLNGRNSLAETWLPAVA